MRLVQTGLKELGGMSSGTLLVDVMQVVLPGAESRAGHGWHCIWWWANKGGVDRGGVDEDRVVGNA